MSMVYAAIVESDGNGVKVVDHGEMTRDGLVAAIKSAQDLAEELGGYLNDLDDDERERA